MEGIKESREHFTSLGNIYPKEDSVKVAHVLINEVSCYWFTPENEVSKKIIIYLHGGAFVLGSIQSHESMVSHFSKKLQAKILFVEYALAPENPYPKGFNDVIKVYETLIKDYPDYNIEFIGDSAGGGLIVSSIEEMLKKHIQLPQAVVLICPWISLSCNNPSYEENRTKDTILTKELLKSCVKTYTGNIPIEKSSPENALLSKFPPVLIIVSSTEILLDDSKNFYNSIKKVQQDATLTIYENQSHVWPLTGIYTEASQKALAEIENFLMEQTNDIYKLIA